MRPLLCLLAILVLSGCSKADSEASFDRQTVKTLQGSLKRDVGVAVQVPEDARFRESLYLQSGQKAATAFKNEFDRFAPSTKLLEGCKGKVCIESAGREGAGYLVAVEILHWEERQTAWSGKRDRLTLKVAVFDVASGAELTSAYLHGTSAWATLGGDHVDDLLPSMVPPYVSSLY